MMKIIIFNGPPGSGKDACAEHIMLTAQQEYLSRVGDNEDPLHAADALYALERFSAPLKAMIPALLNRTHQELEVHKDEPIHMGLSYRELQISASEAWLKCIWGQSVFGRLLGERMLRYTMADESDKYILSDDSVINYVIPDSGFREELTGLSHTLIDAGVEHQILFIRLHRPRHTFENDSRDYLPVHFLRTIPHLSYRELFNDDDLPALYRRLDTVVMEPWKGLVY